MSPSLRSILGGTRRSEHHRSLVFASALGVFVTTFTAYAIGVFYVSGGIILIPFHAAVAGMIAGCWVGYSRHGVLFAWVATYASLLGYRADHAFLGLSGREFTEQLTYFVRLDGLVFLAVEGIVFGTLAFVLGALVRWGLDSFQNTVTPMRADKGS